jgi:hypothetical protein
LGKSCKTEDLWRNGVQGHACICSTWHYLVSKDGA